MEFIVAQDIKRGIGRNGQLLFHIPEDMSFFKETTTGHVVVMGRNTLESFPHGKPLKDRTNIVLSRNATYDVPGATVLNSLSELAEELKKYENERVFLIGGASLYERLLPCCTGGYVTQIAARSSASDSFFPDISGQSNWQMKKVVRVSNMSDIAFRICYYENTDVVPLEALANE